MIPADVTDAREVFAECYFRLNLKNRSTITDYFKGVKTMVDEYIKRETVIKGLELSIASWGRDCNSNAPIMVNAYREMLSRVKKYPAADVVEVVHGCWETKPTAGGYEVCMKCSVCGFQFDNWQHIFKYCPVCGAKMDGERSNASE